MRQGERVRGPTGEENLNIPYADKDGNHNHYGYDECNKEQHQNHREGDGLRSQYDDLTGGDERRGALRQRRCWTRANIEV